MHYEEWVCQKHGGSSILSSEEGAVRIVRDTGKPIAQVARDLGINAGTLGNWVAKDRAERRFAPNKHLGGPRLASLEEVVSSSRARSCSVRLCRCGATTR